MVSPVYRRKQLMQRALIETALPAIHIGEGNTSVSLFFPLVIHHLNFVE